MDLGTLISKIRTALEWLLKDQPRFSGTYLIRVRFKDGRIVHLKKGRRGDIL